MQTPSGKASVFTKTSGGTHLGAAAVVAAEAAAAVAACAAPLPLLALLLLSMVGIGPEPLADSGGSGLRAAFLIQARS